SVEARIAGEPRLTAVQSSCFAAGWLGMRPGLFARLCSPSLPGAGRIFNTSLVHLLTGAVLVACARRIAGEEYGPCRPAVILATIRLLVGFSFILHFGIVHISVAFWRLWGIDARPRFKAPLRSRSLTEFWGRRWNLAFVEMTAIAVYRPLHSILGRPLAIL